MRGFELIKHTLGRAEPRPFFLIAATAAAVYLIWKKRNRTELILGIYAVVIMAAFLFPPFASFAARFMRDGDVYWRFLWIFPTAVLVSFACVRLTTLSSKRIVNIAAALAAAVCIVLCGKNLYASGAYERSTGKDKVEMETLIVADAIEKNIAATGNTYAHLAGGEVVSWQIREITSSVTLFTGRVLHLDWVKETNPGWYRNLLVLYGAKYDDEHKVVKSLKKQGCNYIMMFDKVGCNGDLTEQGYSIIYTDPEWKLWYNPAVKRDET